jgi:hypothetical protein
MGEVITLVKLTLSEIEEWLRSKHSLPSTLSEARLEGKELILYFKDDEQPQERFPDPQPTVTAARIRRARKKRNRMRTRGWAVEGRITNSKGQTCAIYKPFVEALSDPNLDAEQQKKVVETILRSNRNKPSEDSIRYFLDNTLEYLKGKQQVA